MRSPKEQDDFLEHGRFGEGAPSLIRTAFSTPVIIGLVLIALGSALAGIAVLLGIGRDDGGPFFLMGFFLCVGVGSGFCLWGLVSKLISRRTR
jgi:hypothetical protein